jgi:hypothetical protein
VGEILMRVGEILMLWVQIFRLSKEFCLAKSHAVF